MDRWLAGISDVRFVYLIVVAQRWSPQVIQHLHSGSCWFTFALSKNVVTAGRSGAVKTLAQPRPARVAFICDKICYHGASGKVVGRGAQI
jgi:hypothetical protein